MAQSEPKPTPLTPADTWRQHWPFERASVELIRSLRPQVKRDRKERLTPPDFEEALL